MELYGRTATDAIRQVVKKGSRMYEIREFEVGPRPKGLRKRSDKQCFINSFRVALNEDDVAYVEGLALSRVEDDFWIHHAWNVDKDGNAFDITWKDPGPRYVGMVIDDVFSRAGADYFESMLGEKELDEIREFLGKC